MASPDEPFALVVGQNRPRKNLGLLAQAWDLLDPDETLALVSAGPNDSRFASLEQLASTRTTGTTRTTSTTGRVVRSLGFTTEAELAWLYAHARLVLFPSCYEGFGFPLVEAFASNVPVLAADIPVFREVGAEGAAYAAPDDPRAWASVMRLSRDDAARAALVNAGRERAAAHLRSDGRRDRRGLARGGQLVSSPSVTFLLHWPLVTGNCFRPGQGRQTGSNYSSRSSYL